VWGPVTTQPGVDVGQQRAPRRRKCTDGSIALVGEWACHTHNVVRCGDAIDTRCLSNVSKAAGGGRCNRAWPWRSTA
jgi:hypothetical protein